MARCNCNPMCERCCNGPCDCTCEPEAAPIDDRLAGGGDFDVIAFLDRELAATGAQSYDSTAEGLMRTKGYIAALRQRCEQAEADAREKWLDAFVQGAKWWEWHKTGATMWQSDQAIAYNKAQAKHAALAHDAQEKK